MGENDILTWRAATEYLVQLAEALPDEAWDTGSDCGDWTNRELLAHLATGYVVRIATLRAFVEGLPLSGRIDVEDANSANVARLAAASRSDVVSELRRVRGEVEGLLAAVVGRAPGELVQTEDGPEALASYVGRINKHDHEHAAQVRFPAGWERPVPAAGL